MQYKVGAGAVAGLAGGVVVGIMMQMMTVPIPNETLMSVMATVAKMVGSNSLFIGWLYHLFNSAVIGAIFALLLGNRATNYSAGFQLGAIYGIAWWVLGGLILMPLLLGMSSFAPIWIAPMRIVALVTLIGHVIYGFVMGGVFVILTRGHEKIIHISTEHSRRTT